MVFNFVNFSNFKISALNVSNSRIEAIADNQTSYFYCKSGKVLSIIGWQQLYTELASTTDKVTLISKTDWMNHVKRIFYYQMQANLNPEYTFTWGDGQIRYSLVSLTSAKSSNIGEVVSEICDYVEADLNLNWEHASNSWPILKDVIPKNLTHQTKRINAEVEFRNIQRISSAIKPAKRRMCLILNGPTSSGKTKLSELVFKRLDQRKVLSLRNVSWDDFKGAKLWDKLPAGISRFEAIRFEEFGPEHFDFTEWTKFSQPTVTRVRIMRGFESTVNLKVTIFTTVKPPVSWIKERSEDIDQLLQITKRSFFTINLIGESKYSETPQWEYVKDRAFLYGDVQHQI